MHRNGRTPTQIAQDCELSVNSVKAVLRRFRKRGTVVTPEVAGRPKKLSDRDARSLIREIKMERRSTLADLTNSTSTEVSQRTVRRTLQSCGIHNRVARKNPFLGDAHEAKRLSFAKKYVDAPDNFLESIIWCDE